MSTLHDLRRSQGLYLSCPSCEGTFPVRDAQLFDATKPFPDYAAAYLAAAKNMLAEEQNNLRIARRGLKRRSFTSALTSGIGQILEMLCASLPGLPAAPQDCRVLLKPIDYIAFTGACTGVVESITFMEVKSGRQRLNPAQNAIKAAVEKGAVTLRIADHRLPIE